MIGLHFSCSRCTAWIDSSEVSLVSHSLKPTTNPPDQHLGDFRLAFRGFAARSLD